MACKVSDIDDGGYDVMFIEEPPEFLLCIVCHLVLRNPIQIIDCGHRFCGTCFEKMKRNSNERGIGLLCPLDRQVIDVSKVFPDKLCDRLVMELKVNCEYHGKGCQWTGDLSSLQPHLNVNCLYEFVSCAHKGCEEKSERRLLDEHMTNCSKRVVVAADNLKLIQILTRRLQDLQESQVETKEELKETKEQLKETKDELEETKDELKKTNDELKETKDELKLKNGEMKKFQDDFMQQIQVLQKEVEKLKTNKEEIIKLPNDSTLQKCKEDIVQNRNNFSSLAIKPNFQVLSEKIGEEVIQVKLGEWFTWKSNVPITIENPLYSPSYLTDDGYHFKIQFSYYTINGYYLYLYVFKDELNLKRGFSKKKTSQIGDYKNSKDINIGYQSNYFDKSSWSCYYLSGAINKRDINKNITNNYISIQLMIE